MVTDRHCGRRYRVTLADVERPELTISVHRTPGEATVNLSGEIDMLTATRLSNTVNDILSDPPPRIVLNLAGVTFCDSQGLGTLVWSAGRPAPPRACWC